MWKKILILVFLILIILTGCTKIDGNNIDNIVDSAISNKKKANTVSTKYELYIPIGVIQTKDNEYNQVFKIKDEYIYLYVDTTSYYHKNVLNYPTKLDYNYYYREIAQNGKSGYIGINKMESDTYFCKIVYNYSKIEFYTNLEDMPVIIANSLILQDSIKYNDKLIKKDFEDSIKNGREIKYELKKPKDSKSTFSKYLQEYVAEEEVKLPNDN